MNTEEIIDSIKSVSDTDLTTIFNACLYEQRQRDKEKIDNAIGKFRNAYNGLKELNIDLYVNDDFLVYSWDDFSFR